MKFLVDELPYYYGPCPFRDICHVEDMEDCPRVWGKYKVCSDNNPHECVMLKEIEND